MNSNPRWSECSTKDFQEAMSSPMGVGDHLERMIKHIPGCLHIIRREHSGWLRMVYASQGLSSISGVNVADAMCDMIALVRVLHTKDARRFAVAIHNSHNTGKPVYFVYRINHSSTGLRWLESRLEPVTEPDGTTAWYGFTHDVTERELLKGTPKFIANHRAGTDFLGALAQPAEPKAIEKILGDSEYMLHEAQRIAHIGSWAVDLVNNRFVWSDAISRIWEIDKTKIKRDFAAFLEAVHPQDRARVSQLYLDAIRNHSLYEVEHRLLFPDGRVKHILAQGEPQYDAQGKPVRVIGTSLDITERKNMEEQLRMKEYALDHSGDAVFLIDEAARFIYVNEQACNSLGYGRAELLQMHVPDIDPNYPLEKAQGVNAKVVTDGFFTLETCHRRRDGSIFPVEVQLSSFEYAGRTLAMSVVRNITERKRLQNALVEREREFRSLAENLPDNIARWDVEGRYLYVNPTHERTLGMAASDVMGQPVTDMHAHVKAAIARVIATGQIELVRQTTPVGDETQLHEVSLVPEFDAEGRLVSVLGLGRDMTEFYRMQQAIVERERELRALIDNTPDTITRFNRDGRCVFANKALANRIEGGLNAVLGKTPAEVLEGEQVKLYEIKLREVLATGVNTECELIWSDKNGRQLCNHIRLTAEFDVNGTVVTVLAVGRDLTELNSFRQKIHQMAFYDSLTSLPNRALFNDRLHQVLHEAEWRGQLAGVMLLDLDRFKGINDSLGHPAGDALLREAALRLTSCVHTHDTVARLGGDEFAILLPDIRSGADLERVARKILAAFNDPFFLEGSEVFATTSIGIAMYPDDDTDSNELIKQADSAMYFAKRSGRNNFRFYSKDLTASTIEKLSLESELRHALERNELELYYQPKVRMGDNMLVGSEALLRWNNPQRGIVPPKEFISIAEDSGLIIQIGQWVLRDACRTACEWNGADKPLHKVAINLSARQFQSNDLLRTVRDVLEEIGCQPQWIELEITESLLLDEQGQVLEMLKSLSAMGVTIAIDDFGTGYSSLNYLARFPINTLKIDRSFIDTLTTEHFRGELVKAILSIARCLGQEVVAEGVRTLEQAAFLQAHGCQVAQGYLYSKPVPKAAFDAIYFAKRPG